MLTRVCVCAYMGAARLAELRRSRRNLSEAGQPVEGRLSRRTYPMVVVLHTLVIAGSLLRGGPPRWGWIMALVLVQPLRFWALWTLGPRWNARGAVSPQTDVATGGPYAFVRHPNYAVVLVELFCLPMAFGLGRLALAGTMVNAALIAIRIRDEEAMLFRLPGYREHFGNKPRFVPGVF